MRRLVRPVALWAAWLSASGAGCHAVSPAGTGAPDADAPDAEAEVEADAEADAEATRDAGDGAGGACAAEDESCAELACCGELECLSLNGGALSCHAPCREATECGSGCCVEARIGGAAPRRLCGEASICFPDGCEPEGQACGADTPCCAGLACVSGAVPASRNGCRARCERNEDCDSGCCTFFRGGEGGFCDDAIYCTCIDPGEACSGSGRSCCDGSRCARFGDAPFRCLATCESAADCNGNCCSAIRDGASVCAPSPC
jgi:hypothetical protein